MVLICELDLHLSGLTLSSKNEKMKNIKYFLGSALAALALQSCGGEVAKQTESIYAKETATMSKSDLIDKIKGGWAGQTIGVIYGAPTEFKFQGTTIQDYQPIPWNDTIAMYWWNKKPGLFDDIYNDLTFVETFEKFGLQVPVETLARQFADADYHLAHANQAGRYNIRQGIMPPASGHWMNNPHADDLDFQIEADFIGLMTPGMLKSTHEIADKVGHIMNSGDGYYGGVFVSSLYSLAFVSNDVEAIINQALKYIPQESTFYQCIADVIKWHKQYPNDWEATWFELHKKWNNDVGCPKGVFLSFNIDAKINSAYIALAMLYGKGDFVKSMEISTRCGQDSDCNPSSVCGILGVMHGYSNIPAEWLNPLKAIEDKNFLGTTVSLNNAYDYSLKHALELIKLNGGKVEDNQVEIPLAEPAVLPLEQNFVNTHPIARNKIDESITKEYSFDFNGNGFVVYGNLINVSKMNKDYMYRVTNRFGSEIFALAEPNDTYVAQLEVYIDGVKDQTVNMPMKNPSRRLEPAWKYQLNEGNHKVTLKWLNPNPNYEIRVNDIVIYSEKGYKGQNLNL